MTLKQQLTTELKKVLEEIGIENIVPSVDYPTDPRYGDYATNVALVVAKKLGKNPRELAQELQTKLQDLEFVEKVEIAGPGFINFWIKESFLLDRATTKDSIHGNLTGKKISVEYTDPNPFKEFHIGHLYSNTVGESLSRLLEANGATVWRADYFGDVGMHVAKSLWGLKQKFAEDGQNLDGLEKLPLEERIKYLGQAYSKGATVYEDTDKNSEAVQEMKQINRLIYLAAQKMWQEEKNISPQIDYKQGHPIDEKEFEEIYTLYKTGRQWSLEYFELIYNRLGTKFSGYYPESLAAERGYTLVKDNMKNNVFVESNDAIVFPGEKYGLHTRVFINALGLPTYEAKELGLAPWKYEEFPYDESYIVTGNEINEYFNVLICAIKQINPDLGKKTKHLGHGMVRLPEGKMSSRKGIRKELTGMYLIEDAKREIGMQKMGLTAEEVSSNSIAEDVAVGAVKYALLKQGIGKDVIFNLEESVSFEGNSGPYLQYTYARTQSVIGKWQMANSEWKKEDHKPLAISYKPEDVERELLRLLARYPEIVQEAAERLAPNVLCTYLFEVAQAFNLFYQKCPILKAASNAAGAEGDVRGFRLMLTNATGEILQKGLSLLGIKAPEKM